MNVSGLKLSLLASMVYGQAPSVRKDTEDSIYQGVEAYLLTSLLGRREMAPFQKEWS